MTPGNAESRVGEVTPAGTEPGGLVDLPTPRRLAVVANSGTRLTPLPDALDRTVRILSYGGGTQSAALALMSAEGIVSKLDAVIFADTHGELPETYEYAEYVKGRLLDVGIPFITITSGSLEGALLSPVRTMHNPTPPAHVVNPDGTDGRINAYRCSYDYKRRIITKATKELVGKRGAWKHANVEQWIGFSRDEGGRCKPDPECRCSHNKLRPPAEKGGPPRGHLPASDRCSCTGFDPWRTNRWPLIEMGYKREDTIKWFRDHLHPTPPRSACWFCPNQRNGRWSALKRDHPDLFERACALDAHIREGAAFNARGNQPFAGRMFLHESRVPLAEADLRSKGQIEEDGGQGALFDEAAISFDCEGGVCFT